MWPSCDEAERTHAESAAATLCARGVRRRRADAANEYEQRADLATHRIRYANIPPTRKCNRRGVSFNPLKVGVRDARVSVEFEIQRHPALISSLTPASECHRLVLLEWDSPALDGIWR